MSNSKRWSIVLTACFGAMLLSSCVKEGDKADKVSDESEESRSSSSDLDTAKALVKGASGGRAEAVSVFDGPSGLKGIVTVSGGPSGPREIVWASSDLEVLIPGVALSASGENLNEQALQEQNVYVSADQVAEEVEDLGFIVGTDGPILTAFMDANCIWCNRFYNEVTPMVKDGKLRIRYIMAGFLTPTSVPKAVAIMGSKDPAKELDRIEKNFGDEAFDKKYAEMTDLDSVLQQRVADNNALMASFGQVSTPAFIACVDGKVQTIHGFPQELESFVESLDKNPTVSACK